MEYKDFLEAARLIVNDGLAIKKGERVMILTDHGVDTIDGLCNLRQALLDVMVEQELDPVTLYFPCRPKSDMEIPELAEVCCRQADVLIVINETIFIHSASFTRAFKYGERTRMLVLPSGRSASATDFFYRTLPVTKEQFYEVGDITTKVGAKISGGVHKVHLMAGNGTDMTFEVGTLRQAIHTGIAHEPGMAIQMPAGCVNMGVNEGTANGTMVVDYTSAVSKGRMNGKVIFEIKDGYATSISGDEEEVNKFITAAAQHEGTQQEKYNVAEFGLGMLRKAEMNGSGGEGEYLYGGAHIGLGSNVAFWGKVFIPAWHVDCIIPCATVEVDDELILKDGEYLV